VVEFAQGGTVQGYVSINGGTTSYNAFTGSHFAKIDSGSAEPYQLVSLTGNNAYRPGSPEPIYGVNKTAIANDPNVLGALLGISDGSQTYSEDNPYLVMAAGNGDVWVADNGSGNVNIGDPLLSSGDLSGYAMRDNGRYQISHVFAKAAEPINWDTVSDTINGIKVKKVSILFSYYNHENTNNLLQTQGLNVDGVATIQSLIVNGTTALTDLNVTGNAQFASINVVGNLAVQGNVTIAGTLNTADIYVNGHIVTKGGAPTSTVGTALGTNGSGSTGVTPTVTVDGTDNAGTITADTGTQDVLSGVIAHVSFSKAFDSSYKVVVGASNDNAADVRVYIVKTAEGFDVVSRDNLLPELHYAFDYVVLGAQN
jgi:hypothetical protein